jgi:hypothetical protein
MREGHRPPPGAAREPVLLTAMLPFARAASRRRLLRQVDGLERIGRGPMPYAGNDDGGMAGPDLGCTLGSLWDVLGPEAPLYALARDFARRRLRSLGAALQRLGSVQEASRPGLRSLEP